jgi:hypothetical protein
VRSSVVRLIGIVAICCGCSSGSGGGGQAGSGGAGGGRAGSGGGQAGSGAAGQVGTGGAAGQAGSGGLGGSGGAGGIVTSTGGATAGAGGGGVGGGGAAGGGRGGSAGEAGGASGAAGGASGAAGAIGACNAGANGTSGCPSGQYCSGNTCVACNAGWMVEKTYPIVNQGINIAVGDLDGDGTIDVVAPNEQYDGSVSVLLNDGKGGLQVKQDFPAGHNPSWVTLGDVNGDGLLDAVVVNSQLTTLLGQKMPGGSWSLAAPLDSAVSSGHWPWAVALADVNHDGHVDAVTANESSNSISVLLGDGTGAFTPAKDYPLGAQAQPRTIALGDLDGDGAIDAVLPDLTGGGTIDVLLGDGAGGFGAIQSHVSLGAYAVYLRDLDGDGLLDVIAGNGQNRNIGVFLGQKVAGAWSLKAPTLSVSGSVYNLAFGDLDGDGRVDVATESRVGGGNTLLGQSQGGAWSFGAARSYSSVFLNQYVELADMNGDGLPDLITSEYSSPTAQIGVQLAKRAPQCGP